MEISTRNLGQGLFVALCCMVIATGFFIIMYSDNNYYFIGFTDFMANSFRNETLSKIQHVQGHATPHKTILLWTPRSVKRLYSLNNRLRECERSCSFTKDHQQYANADLVIFQMDDLASETLILPPGARPENQRWVFLSKESPAHAERYRNRTYQAILRKTSHLFNMTMTYHRKSDIVFPYSVTKERNITKHKNKININISKKSKLVLWFVSHCIKFRTDYVNELKQYIDTDVYGACGSKDPCARDEACLVKLKSRYKFYIAFENYLCQDYITEKFWRALKTGMVPIVMGPSIDNYKELAPPKSFIHVDSFSSPKQLADYLLYLDRNDTAYAAYHAWRKTHRVASPSVCVICDTAHTVTKRIYSDVMDYWSRDNLCQSPTRYLNRHMKKKSNP